MTQTQDWTDESEGLAAARAANGVAGLHSKMAAAQAAIGTMPRSGHARVETKTGGSYEYDYVTESDLMDAVKKELSKLGVATYVSCERQWEEAGATRVEVLVTFADGETGQTFAVRGQGAGTDKGDKGVYKAQTGAVRYVLWKTFLVPTGDEPDADHTDSEQHAEQARAATRKSRMRARIVALADAIDKIRDRATGTFKTHVEEIVQLQVGARFADLSEPELEALGRGLKEKLAYDEKYVAGGGEASVLDDEFDVEWPTSDTSPGAYSYE